MRPRKDSSKSDLRKNERMIREMQAWMHANVPPHLIDSQRRDYQVIGQMIRAAFCAGWKSKNLKQHEKVLGS